MNTDEHGSAFISVHRRPFASFLSGRRSRLRKPGATKPSSEGAALAVTPARQVVFGGSLLDFVVARRRPLGEAAFLQALQEAAAAARVEHKFLLFGQLLGGLEALAGNRGLARPDV